jgi:hypothetical protein
MWCLHVRGHFVRSFVGEEFADEMIKLDKKFEQACGTNSHPRVSSAWPMIGSITCRRLSQRRCVPVSGLCLLR